MEGIRATLQRYRVEFDTYFLEGSLHEGDPSPIAVALDAAARAGAPVRVRGRAVAADDRVRRRQGPRARALDRRADVLRRRRRLPGGQVPARLRPRDLRARRRPPRLHRAAEGDRELARRGPGPRRDPDPAVRAHRRGRRPGEDVQAPRRLRDARRADRADRRRRHALVHALALARLDDRPRRRARGQAGPGEPRLLRAVRARADRVDLRATSTTAGWRRRSPPSARRDGAQRLRARADRAGCSRSRARCARRSSGARRTGSRATRSSSAQAFAAFYRDSPVREEPDAALRASGSRSASRRSARSPARSACSASPPRSRCDDHRPRAAARAVRARRQPRPGHLQRRRSACSIPASQLRSCAETFRSSPPRAARPAARGRTSSAAT